jgi:hypothetical protein
VEILVLAEATGVLLAKGAATEAGKSAWSGIKRLSTLVRDKLSQQPEGASPLESLEGAPDDLGIRQVLTAAVAGAAESDRDFRKALEDLVAEAERDTTVGRIVTQVFGSGRVGKVTNIEQVQGDVTF